MPVSALSTTQIPGTVQTIFIPYGTPNAAATAVVTNAVHRLWVTTQPTYILGMQLVRKVASADASLTYTPGYIAATTALGALTALSATATADASGPIDIRLDTSGNTITTASGSADDTLPALLPAGSVVGFTTSAATVTNALIMGVIIKYRCPNV